LAASDATALTLRVVPFVTHRAATQISRTRKPARRSFPPVEITYWRTSDF
jgi:hypothetical protein